MQGLHLDEGIHQVDHLGPLCAGLGVPILLTDPFQSDLSKKYYPDLDVRLVDREAFLPENLSKTSDILLLSNFLKKTDFQALFQSSGKKMRSIYCPHGNSDKGSTYYWMEHFAHEDCVLLYGERMIDFLKEKNVFDSIENYVITGNYRLLYYLKHQEFYAKIVQDEVAIKLNPKKKTILYAPTWNQEDTSFFTAFSYVLDGLPEEYNLVVKLHPGLLIHHLGTVLRMVSKYQGRKNILFLDDFPPIYPVLDFVDIYIGDMSSIGYDFLYFNKPMYFLHNQIEASKYPFYLYQAGVVISSHEYVSLYSTIENTLSFDAHVFSEKRRAMYAYTFGNLKSFEDIRKDITLTINSNFNMNKFIN
ncbi:MAG: CDP-glycerol glycerophosphotransferase family protein [Chlamydiales bacterium]|nr:CDP-glycerol glycerophosphotransferase family protein [Chlamydiales bacterium]